MYETHFALYLHNSSETHFSGNHSKLLKEFTDKFSSQKKQYLQNRKSMSKRQKKNLQKKSKFLRKKHFESFLDAKHQKDKQSGGIVFDDFEKALKEINAQKESKGTRQKPSTISGKEIKM